MKTRLIVVMTLVVLFSMATYRCMAAPGQILKIGFVCCPFSSPQISEHEAASSDVIGAFVAGVLQNTSGKTWDSIELQFSIWDISKGLDKATKIKDTSDKTINVAHGDKWSFSAKPMVGWQKKKEDNVYNQLGWRLDKCTIVYAK